MMTDNKRKLNLAILFTNYGPYHLARVKQFQRHAKQIGWQVTGVELTRTGVAYKWETNLEDTLFNIISILGEQAPQNVNAWTLINQVCKTFRNIAPDVVIIGGYFRLAMIVALFWCKICHVPIILLSESKEDDSQRNWLLEHIKSCLIRCYTSALVGGKVHKRYLLKLGMPHQAIFLGYDVVGNETFCPTKIRVLPSPLGRPYFLTVNRFLPKKNILRMLSAYAKYCEAVPENRWDLVLCGDGPLREQIEQKIDGLVFGDSVHITGFLQQEELLPFFAHASCFIHASYQEQWGLVVNEAMAAGLPVLVSNTCGCFEDLVIEGVNGFGFDPEDVEELAALMIRMGSGTVDLIQMGEASLAHIANYSPDYFAKGLVDAVQYALAQNQSKKL